MSDDGSAARDPVDDLPRLITLPISPFNELARWSLERRCIPYREEPKALVWHTVASRLAGGKGTTPVLVTPSEVVPESPQIAEWADRRDAPGPRLFPDGPEGDEVRKLVHSLVDELGPQTRRIAWGHLIDDLPLADRSWGQGLQGWQRDWQLRLLTMGKPVIRRRLGLAELDEAGARVRAIFDDVADTLGDGRRYLCGESITAADLAFASMAMPAILPDEGFPVPLPRPDEMGKMARTIHELRERPAGQFALRLYRDERAPRG
ncbi:MAG TPA: glutathione S-transferase family protein [Solirubrobacterales bacterium]|nr:glutathione S-transferase family protein [Solirubrobacterales bacterium]